MATRLYADVYTAASSYPARSSIWDDASASPLRYKLDRARFGGGLTLNATYVETSATNAFQAMLWQCVSEPLSGDQTISGTWRGIARCTESATAANFISQTVIRVFSGDMTTERGVLYGGNTETTVIGEWGTSSSGASMVPQNSSTNGGIPLDTALSTVNALDGDVIVIEFGFRAINTVTTSYTANGTLYNNQNTTLYPDYPTINGSGSVTWIEFSQDLVFAGDYWFGDADDIDAPFDLTGTMTTPVALALSGSIDVDVDITPTNTFTDRKIGRDDYEALVVASAPYVYWPLTEGTGASVPDASGNGRDGVITNGAWNTAISGSAYGDTGYTFTTVVGNITWTGTLPAASTSEGFTVMATVMATASANIRWNSASTNIDPWFLLTGTTEYFYVSGNSTGDRLTTVKNPISTPYNMIFRVTKVDGNTTLTVEQFRFGKVMASRSVFGLVNDGTQLSIGTTSTTGANTWQQVAYWDRPLTDEEIDAFQNAYLIEPTPQAIAGDADLDVGLEGTLTFTSIFMAAGEADLSVELEGTLSIGYPMSGDLDVDVDLAATQSITYPMAGEITEDVDLTGTGTFTVLMDASLDVDVSLEGDVTVGIEITPLDLFGELDVDVSLEGDLFVPTQLLLAGSIDLEFDLYGDSFEESFRAGTLDIPFGLDATLTSAFSVPASFSTLTLGTLTGAANVETILVPLTLTVETDTYIFAKVRSPLVIPPAPEPALPGEIPVASGVLLRALHGVIVDMATPAIEDGQPS